MENKNINPIGPVINNYDRQLNNINETTPAIGAENAENQRHVEQAVDGRQLQANSEQQMPDTEVQVRNGEVVNIIIEDENLKSDIENMRNDLDGLIQKYDGQLNYIFREADRGDVFKITIKNEQISQEVIDGILSDLKKLNSRNVQFDFEVSGLANIDTIILHDLQLSSLVISDCNALNVICLREMPVLKSVNVGGCSNFNALYADKIPEVTLIDLTTCRLVEIIDVIGDDPNFIPAGAINSDLKILLNHDAPIIQNDDFRTRVDSKHLIVNEIAADVIKMDNIVNKKQQNGMHIS